MNGPVIGSWSQLEAQSDGGGAADTAARPCPRDIWGNSFVYDGALYVFGGAWERYGQSSQWREHGCLGGGDDLWRFDPSRQRWELLEEDSWSLAYGPDAERPGSRFLGAWSVVGEFAYLFGGLAVLEPGFVLRALNDLWRLHVPTGRWELIHPDTGWCNFANRPSHPPIRGGHRMVAVDQYLYLFGGWPGTVPVFTVNDLWRFDTGSARWDQCRPWQGAAHDAGYTSTATYPGPRYCFNLWEHDGTLVLFSGRDTGAKEPEFFNDLWRYEPERDRWTLLYPSDGHTDFGLRAGVPAGRYGSGHTRLGDYAYLFGGHNGTATRVERNDFWRLHLPTQRWQQLAPDEGSTDYGPQARYPGTRRVPVLEAIGSALYLFGGINCFMGPRTAGYSLPLNDLWRFELVP